MNETSKHPGPGRALHARACACAAVVCAALLLASCYSSSELSGDGSEDAAADDQHHPEIVTDQPQDPIPETIVDVGIDDARPDELPGPGITFILSFITDIPGYEYLYAQTSDPSCRMTWVSVTDGTMAFRMQDDCAICACDECGSCAVCGMCMTAAARVGGGESVTYEWDGMVHAVGRCASDPSMTLECEYTDPLASGGYIARFCFAVAGPDAFPDGVITDPACEDVPFTYPVPGGVVRYTVNNSG